MKRLHLLISGRVQGVSFRYYSQLKAEELAIAGWVKNLPDGRVEIMAEGELSLLGEFLDWVKQGPSLAKVEKVDVEWFDCDQCKYQTFEIEY